VYVCVCVCVCVCVFSIVPSIEQIVTKHNSCAATVLSAKDTNTSSQTENKILPLESKEWEVSSNNRICMESSPDGAQGSGEK
jgi:hypothetical protein